MIIDLSKINFGGGGGSKIKVQDVKVVTQNVDSSGAYDFQPDEGYDAMKAVKANLTIPSTPVEAIDLKTGIKFGYSSFSAVPYTLICDSGVTSLFRLFSNCTSLKTLDLSNFNTSNATDMIGMFSFCQSLTSLDLSNFDTSKVTTMSIMFKNSNKLSTLDLSNFDTIKVTDMDGMFYYCDSLTTVKVTNCDESTKNKILTQLQTDLKSYTWTLGDDGIITRSETT